jgi:hypothetical protein
VTTFVVSFSAVTLHYTIDERYLSDEWYFLGANLRTFGVIGFGDKPTALRPPGYPAIIALALLTRERPDLVRFPDAVSAHPMLLVGAFGALMPRSVYCVHAILWALGAASLFLWLSLVVRLPVAIAATLVAFLNPYGLVLVGTQGYAVAHVCGIALGGLALEAFLGRPSPGAAFASGALWGAVTLLRPVTLILPPFVWAMPASGGSPVRLP